MGKNLIPQAFRRLLAKVAPAALLLILSALFVRGAETSLDRERLDLELSMQSRVEAALSKILPGGQFVVVIRVEPMAKFEKNSDDAEEPKTNAGEAYYLPGVPAITKFDGSAEAVNKLSDKIRPPVDPGFMKFVRRISATLVLDKDLSEEMVNKVRELTRQMLGLDPARGDTLDIQRTAFQKPVVQIPQDTRVSRFQQQLQSYWLIISLALIVVCVTVFFLFVFGPLRGFLNRLVQILPTLKPADVRPRFSEESQILPALLAQSMGLPMPQVGMSPANFSGSLQVENPNKRTMPFGFIREDHLSNLAILLAREAPEKAAVVLGYLPTEWLTRVLSKIDPALQVEITNHLATTRQLLPEQVEDIEQDLKRRLDYLVGGPDRIIAVYESLDLEAQRRMLDSLKTTRPDIAAELRARTFLFEDIEKLDSNALKSLLREVDLQTLVQSLTGATATLKQRVLEHLTEGKAEIVREELELNESRTPGRATLDAQKKVSLIARRLEKDGQISIPSSDGNTPASRYGTSLRSTLKLPQGLQLKENQNQNPPTEEAQVIEPPSGIEERIRKFMNRRSAERGRFSMEEETLRAEPRREEE